MKLSSLICGLLTLLLSTVASAEDPPAVKVLLIGKNPDHPYGSHMYMHTLGVLAKCLELSPGMKPTVSNGWPEDAAATKDVKTIVVYSSPGAEFLLDSPKRDEFAKLMNSGVGLVTIHWACAVKKENLERLGPTWIGFLGGAWVSNVGLGWGKSNLKQLAPEHPICRGWKEYEIDDEYYLHPTIGSGSTSLLQVTDKKGGDTIVGWSIERKDGGRAFGTTLGHPYRNFEIEAFRRMIVNGILWTAKVEVPKDGAPVGVAKEVLALPPEMKK